ncbi:MAG TPA: hypothetical protein VK762_18585 [Polyangiaceae bacterium]|jgi:hypothetical protein|nr:hypothetical protein [Polyangiaceae bacterium]
MTESAMDNQVLLRRTLVTAGTMVGGCVLIVGTLTLVALGIVSHAVSPAQGSAAADSGTPATTAHPKPGGAPAATTAMKAK